MREQMKRSACPSWLRLSARLMQVAAFVPEKSLAADIGTDHGYVPIYLACTGKIRGALAMDVGKGPLERAQAHIQAYEQWAAGSPSVSVRTRLSNGLQALRPGEADTVIIAGMGGELVLGILEEGRHMWESVKTWVLSPQSNLDKVRRYLESHGFFIEDEAMVKEDGKFYTVMKVHRGEETLGREIYFRYGKRLIEKREPVLAEYLAKEEKRVRGILDGLEGSGPEGTESLTESQRKARAALEDELGLIKEALYEMQ